jgi:hypothetical protein
MNVKFKWHLIQLVIGFGHLLMIFFPLAWIISRFTRIKKWMLPLWLTMDDTIRNPDGSPAEDYRIFIRDEKMPAWLADIKWHFSRNMMWNLIMLFPVAKLPEKGNQDIKITKMVTNELYDYYGNKVRLDGPWVISAGLKYIGQPGDDPWQVNKGDVISKDHSYVGTAEFYYETPEGFEGWRKTYCRITKPWFLFGAKRWRTVFKGTTSKRWAFKNKYQKIVPWGKW